MSRGHCYELKKDIYLAEYDGPRGECGSLEPWSIKNESWGLEDDQITINDADHGSADVTFRMPSTPNEKSKFLGSGGSLVARLKIKGIDGRESPGVEAAA